MNALFWMERYSIFCKEKAHSDLQTVKVWTSKNAMSIANSEYSEKRGFQVTLRLPITPTSHGSEVNLEVDDYGINLKPA